MGQTIAVRVVPRKEWADDETVGFWNAENQTISVVAGLEDQATQQVFCHELVHAILHNMCEIELNGNEKFVDLFGSLLHQAWTSCK
jgi:Zn-dependent peptidase ImmA (M78 family)